jgi:hypothetical protein
LTRKIAGLAARRSSDVTVLALTPAFSSSVRKSREGM